MRKGQNSKAISQRIFEAQKLLKPSKTNTGHPGSSNTRFVSTDRSRSKDRTGSAAANPLNFMDEIMIAELEVSPIKINRNLQVSFMDQTEIDDLDPLSKTIKAGGKSKVISISKIDRNFEISPLVQKRSSIEQLINENEVNKRLGGLDIHNADAFNFPTFGDLSKAKNRKIYFF